MGIAPARSVLTASVCLALLAGAAPVGADNPSSVSSYYLARGDPRMCPSPQCGGLWVRLVNRDTTTCGDGRTARECYVASADLSRLDIGDATRATLTSQISAGRVLVRGMIVGGRVSGFPQLDTLVASEGWRASSSAHPPSGVFRRLRDNSRRCIAAPCFSIHAAKLNTAGQVELSQVNLAGTGAPVAEQRQALARITTGELIAAGKVVRRPNAGPAGAGRELVASQFYVRVG